MDECQMVLIVNLFREGFQVAALSHRREIIENENVFSIYLHQFSTKEVDGHFEKLIIFVIIDRSKYLRKVK